MRHQIAGRSLSRTSAHRKALMRNMACNLMEHERITTTVAKAKELRIVAERLITKARRNTIEAKRQVRKTIQKKEAFLKLFNEIAPRFLTRPGGYTRIYRVGYRKGDNAEIAIIELVDRKEEAPPATDKKKKVKKAAASKKEAKVVDAEVAE